MVNAEIRRDVFENGLIYRDIARKMGVTPEYLCRILRKELSDRNRKRIEAAIEELKK